MNGPTMILWLPILIVLAIVIYAIVRFNALVGLRQLTRNAWSDVDVYLKRRADLIPNLVQAVAGYAQHEQSTLTKVIEARNQAQATSSVQARSVAEQEVARQLSQVFVLAEHYPQLAASANFLKLQEDLSETEGLIAKARQYFNAVVRDYNTAIQSFPTNLIAPIGGFHLAEFFELEVANERNVPQVQGLP